MKYVCACALGLLAHLAGAQTRSRTDSLLTQAQAARERHDYRGAIAAYQRVVQAPATPPRDKASSLYNIACCYGLGQDTTQALQYLGQAIRAGYVKASHIAVDPDLTLLHATRQWPSLLARARKLEAKTIIRRPEQAPLVTSDIDHFWAAYAAARQDTAHTQALFRRLYFNRASVGMQDCYHLKIRQDAPFTRAIWQRPR